MTDSQQPPLFSALKAEIRQATNDATSLVRSHWQLAVLELKSAARTVAQFALIVFVAFLLALCAFMALVLALAGLLEGTWGISRDGWLAILAGLMMLVAASASYFGWRRFRADFTGFEQTLEELRADAQWLDDLREHWFSRPEMEDVEDDEPLESEEQDLESRSGDEDSE